LQLRVVKLSYGSDLDGINQFGARTFDGIECGGE